MQTTTTQYQPLQLAEGELDAGILLGKDGAPDQRIILLPGAAESLTWAKAKKWAASIGGELPTRREQALLFANLREHFKADWYWSCEANGSGWAWYQSFDDGYQYYGRQDPELRARAVRRLPL